MKEFFEKLNDYLSNFTLEQLKQIESLVISKIKVIEDDVITEDIDDDDCDVTLCNALDFLREVLCEIKSMKSVKTLNFCSTCTLFDVDTMITKQLTAIMH